MTSPSFCIQELRSSLCTGLQALHVVLAVQEFVVVSPLALVVKLSSIRHTARLRASRPVRHDWMTWWRSLPDMASLPVCWDAVDGHTRHCFGHLSLQWQREGRAQQVLPVSNVSTVIVTVLCRKSCVKALVGVMESG